MYPTFDDISTSSPIFHHPEVRNLASQYRVDLNMTPRDTNNSPVTTNRKSSEPTSNSSATNTSSSALSANASSVAAASAANVAAATAAAQAAAVNPSNQMMPTTNTSGMDSLLMAAMIEESAAAMAAANSSHNHHYFMPTGRGLAYPPHHYDANAAANYYAAAAASHSQQELSLPAPTNKCELELYRLLERANLLNYYGTFISFGGDDVRQLSEADEDEFLEIMSLVGMTRKPLHVRRLQHALIDWRIRNNRRQTNETIKED